MGTTLTGTTPQDTYDSLIKVTDNGPLSGSLKKLTDGLGNDSSLSLSTTAASFSGSLTISGDTVGSKFYTAGSVVPTAAVSVFLNANYGGPAFNNSSFVTGNGATGVMIGGDTASYTYGWIQGVQTDNGTAKNLSLQPIGGSVGIGTSAPNAKLAIVASSGSTNAALINDTPTTAGTEVSYLSYFGTDNGGTMFATPLAQIGAISKNGGVAFGDLVFRTTPASGATAERVRILADGGLTFNGDTAAANALDDYEEGTFTATLKGGTTDPTTPVTTTGTYTKIGRQVQVNIFFDNVDTTGASGDVLISGLPFTSSATTMRYTGSVISFNFTFGGTAINTFMGTGSTQFEILSSVTNGAWSNMTHATTGAARYLTIAHTYFV